MLTDANDSFYTSSYQMYIQDIAFIDRALPEFYLMNLILALLYSLLIFLLFSCHNVVNYLCTGTMLGQ